MSAKKSSQQSKVPAATPAPATRAVVVGPVDAEAAKPWIESSDPRRRLIGKIALVALWIYVAALWLLAVDQWFNLGIFGPKIPPVP